MESVRFDPQISPALAWRLVLAEMFLQEPLFNELHVRIFETTGSWPKCPSLLKSEKPTFDISRVSAIAEKFRLYLTHNEQRGVDLSPALENRGFERIEHYLMFARRL